MEAHKDLKTSEGSRVTEKPLGYDPRSPQGHQAWLRDQKQFLSIGLAPFHQLRPGLYLEFRTYSLRDIISAPASIKLHLNYPQFLNKPETLRSIITIYYEIVSTFSTFVD